MKVVERVVRGIEGKTVGPSVMYIAAAVFVICAVLWAAGLFLGYVADDWGSPPVNESSVPAPSAD